MSNLISLGPLTFVTAASDAPDVNGVYWFAEAPLQGWGSPKGTLTVTQKPRDHGGWPSESFLTPRVIVVNGTINAPSASLLAAARHSLDAACSLGSTTFSVTEYGETLNATVQRQDEVLYGDETETWTTFSIQLVAVDPRRYGTVASVTTNMASTSGGLTAPITAPITSPATVVSGVASFFNPGNIAVPVMLRIDGPVTGPIVTHVSSGNQLVFASSLVLASGEWLIIDMEARTVKAQGQTTRVGYVTSRGWFALDPGGNDIAYNGQVYSGTSVLTVTAPQGAWL